MSCQQRLAFGVTYERHQNEPVIPPERSYHEPPDIDPKGNGQECRNEECDYYPYDSPGPTGKIAEFRSGVAHYVAEGKARRANRRSPLYRITAQDEYANRSVNFVPNIGSGSSYSRVNGELDELGQVYGVQDFLSNRG